MKKLRQTLISVLGDLKTRNWSRYYVRPCTNGWSCHFCRNGRPNLPGILQSPMHGFTLYVLQPLRFISEWAPGGMHASVVRMAASIRHSINHNCRDDVTAMQHRTWKHFGNSFLEFYTCIFKVRLQSSSVFYLSQGNI